jgi:hypothetical protein
VSDVIEPAVFMPAAAPADARPQAKWPRWRIVLAYLALTIVACASIWYVDRSAMKVQTQSAHSTENNHE